MIICFSKKYILVEQKCIILFFLDDLLKNSIQKCTNRIIICSYQVFEYCLYYKFSVNKGGDNEHPLKVKEESRGSYYHLKIIHYTYLIYEKHFYIDYTNLFLRERIT